MRYILFSVLTTLIIAGCTKENPIVTPDPVEPIHLIGLDSMMFKRNGVIVKIKGNGYKLSSPLNLCGIYSKERIIAGQSLAEQISIRNIPRQKGKYSIGPYALLGATTVPSVFLFWSVEDVIVGQLESVDSFPDDYIEVIEADTVAKTVEGRFQFHLINKESTHLQEYGLPDSLNITEGVFYLKLQ